MQDFYSIVSEINSRSKNYKIGNLQEIRKRLKGLKRQPSQNIFARSTTFDEWAFHLGGRIELQFNVGIERIASEKLLRHGVAFSLELNQTLPSIDILRPKIQLFNDRIQLDYEKYADMQMWHYGKGQQKPSSEHQPSSIPSYLVKEGVFIFLGKRQRIDQVDYDVILQDFDRLLPMYIFTMRGDDQSSTALFEEDVFQFRSGCTIKPSSTVADITQKELDINLRHNIIQRRLYNHLSTKYGEENVGTEIQCGTGNIDMVVQQNEAYWFYEIKTAHSSRACIRQAIGQLLEYSFWPGGQEASRLVIVGEPALDSYGKEYLDKLKDRFSLPIEYEQIEIG